MFNCESIILEDDGKIPNNPDLPLLVYNQVLLQDDLDPESCKQRLRKHGWTGAWLNGIYNYHHYHSTAHEVLVVVSGRAKVQFGGPEGEVVEVSATDAVVLPAGVGHCLVDSSRKFQVVGAYPDGQHWDLCTGKPGERPGVLKNIKNVPLPQKDPLTGSEEPLLSYWK